MDNLPPDALLTNDEMGDLYIIGVGRYTSYRAIANAASAKAYRAACLEVDGKLLTGPEIAAMWREARREGEPGAKHIAVFAALDAQDAGRENL